MLGFLARRLLALVPLVLGVVLLGFAIVQLAPGDPVQVLVGDYPAPPEYVKQVREGNPEYELSPEEQQAVDEAVSASRI